MPVSIRRIEITNFRSIQKIVIDSARLQIIVGNNDAGKSNILRALNLFFNSQTNPGESFDFSTDYNIYAAKKYSKKAREIKIKLLLDIPSSYHATNGNLIEWTKSWRSGGFYDESILGIKSYSGPRGGRRTEKQEISARSNIRQLLNNVKYVYIPAIKDKGYIAKLRSEIYFVVNAVFNENFSDSSKAFEKSIAENLHELTKEINESLGFNSELSLPRDLSNLFGNLDFLNEMKISLNERGDGIKARHIPLILKYIAEKTKTLQARGNPPYTFIWGYEEPENNLELTSSIKLAIQFKTFVPDPVSQLFITTHSPAFYNLSKQDRSVNCIFIEKDLADVTSCDDKYALLDDRMGVMELLSPYIDEVKSRIENIESVGKLGDEKAVMYVEGASDKIIIERAIQVFIPERMNDIEVITKDFGAGTNYVCDMLKAYYHIHKHHQNKYKCVGIVDADKDGINVKKELGDIQDIGKSVKCFTLKPTQDVLSAKKDGYKIPGVLESNYPIAIWKEELEENNLERRANLNEMLTLNRHGFNRHLRVI
ncbi:ATP-dependent nuclease [Escherichia coli]|uniref:ATP-dependent nuclease n=3 Tax=Escherichia coli TaxID=562 RepID=UPI00215710FC|nr:ATP-binding protein [Escherichia coli]MCW9750823.1 ATP-binding protein [Escherichia coli]MCY1102652.1 ATP-binding protein [Escherichia coli]MCY1116569.1 ATP-binding protein [Escherichia coli]